MNWFIPTLLICVLFLAVAFVASETIIGRLGRSRPHRHSLDIGYERNTTRTTK